MLITNIKCVLKLMLVGGLVLGTGDIVTKTVAAQTKQPPAKEEGSISPEATKQEEGPPHIVEKTDMQGRMPSGLPCTATDDGAVIVKGFFAKMNTYPDIRFREFFDPRYLKQHGLTDRDIAFETVHHHGIDSLRVADDEQTVLVILAVEGGRQEVFVMRCAVYEGHIYISPAKAPDPKTGIIKPWILRTQVN